LPLPKLGSTLGSGEPIIVGIRPSDFELAAGQRASVKGAVHLLEPLGDVTVVSFAPNGKNLRIVLPESRAIGIKLGDEMNVHIDTDKIHIFRAHDGTALR